MILTGETQVTNVGRVSCKYSLLQCNKMSIKLWEKAHDTRSPMTAAVARSQRQHNADHAAQRLLELTAAEQPCGLSKAVSMAVIVIS
ncbi:hypothetical protein J6590_063054 [Homalodisca vitripennis]|nr:hypothetical protein J6590_063054 [Homalodisca vitripennis]